MQTAAASLPVNLHSARNALFFLAVLLMNYTLSRPSPVDIVFLMALAFSLFVNQRIRPNFFLLLMLLAGWTLSFYMSSMSLLGNATVRFELLAKTFVVVLGLIACLVSMSWSRRDYERFLRVYVVSCVVGALLGIAGFVTGNELLTWDARAKGLIDDPNMYSAFLLPGALGCLYLLQTGRARLLPGMALGIIVLGILCSFSRIAVVSLMLSSLLFLAILNRRNLVRLGVYVAAFAAVGIGLLAVASFAVDGFQEKLFDRLTLAKDYDSGHGGRYNRYLLSIPFILQNPLGLGLMEIERLFPEPIHNIVISSFLNYGWLAGFSFLLLLILSAMVASHAYRSARDPMALLLGCSLLSIVLCALLHEAEHWRHMWLYFGLVWGYGVRGAAPVAMARPVPAQ